MFQLFGNGWRFGAATWSSWSCSGSDSGFMRTSNIAFSVKVSNLSVSLPTSGPG